MDRFRIKSMIKLIESNRLNDKQLKAVHRELESKCCIYGKGCIKRGKMEEGHYYLQLPERIKQIISDANPQEQQAFDRPPFSP